MKNTTARMMEKRKEHYQVILIGEGILVGAVSGMVVLAYRILLTYGGLWLNRILHYADGHPIRMAGWFVILALLALVVSRLVTWEPMISGSGIPQVEGEMVGKLDQTWWRVLVAKFTGGFLSLLAGLSLGREGPSIQLGAMAGKGVSKMMGRDKTEERILITCGASAGLSAAFHAPLAGLMFSLEEVHKNFSVSVLISAMASSLTADFISSQVLGLDPVFTLSIGTPLPHGSYWILLILGLLLGLMGSFYNYFTLKVQSFYKNAAFLKPWMKMMIPFLLAGVLGFTYPVVLGSGHTIVEQAANRDFVLRTLILIFVVKFLYSAISFGSGAPGGIFFPLLVLGSLIGAIFGTIGVQYLGWDSGYINNLVLLSMAGYFTAIVRAPLTGIILIFEMTGSVSQLMSLALVSIVAYVVANLMKSAPIYDSLLKRLLQGQKEERGEIKGERVILEFAVMQGSLLENRQVGEIGWPEKCLIVAIARGSDEIIPRGDTSLEASDMLVVMTDESNQGYVTDLMNKLCNEKNKWRTL